MEFDLQSFIVLLSFFLFLATLFRVITPSKLNNSSSTSKLPPGPRKLPLIGNLHQLISSSQPPHRIFNDLAMKYGPLMYLQLGEITTIVISSPEVAEEVMKTHDITFANRPVFFAMDILLYKNTDIVFCSYGEYWRRLRKICTIELLNTKRVLTFRSLRQEECSNMCRWIASQHNSLINLTDIIASTTCDIVTQASLGNNKSKEHEAFVSIAKEATELAAGLHMVDLYPSVKLFRLFSGVRRKAESVHKMSDKLLQKIIDDHKSAKDDKQKKDLADVLLGFNNEHDLSIENIKAVLQDIFLAGTETSSTTTDWAMVELLRHPTVMEKAKEEVRHVFSNKGYVDEADFDKLEYLKLIVKETLRMHPPVPLLIPRESREDCGIFGYHIPKKSRVMVNVWAIGRDPRYWNDPNSFIPERFMDTSIDFKGSNFEYLPFGSGRRICPGMSFGLANVELPLAMLLYHFDWIFPDGGMIDMSESFGVTTRREDPLHIIPIVKNPLL